MYLPGTSRHCHEPSFFRLFSSAHPLSLLLQSGSVRCVRTSCPPAPCSHPVTNACGCPVCDGKRLTLLSAEILKSQKKKSDVSLRVCRLSPPRFDSRRRAGLSWRGWVPGLHMLSESNNACTPFVFKFLKNFFFFFFSL